MIMFSQQTPLMISIWCIMTLMMISILVSAIVINLVFNKDYKKGILSVRKITIFATFLTLLIVQTLIDVYLPSFPGMPSFESMTTIAVGFIFGPLEGILFGWIADTFIVLLHGWSYQLLPGLMMPMIGLIAGLLGLVYRKREEFPKWISIVIFQVTLVILMIVMIATSTTIVDVVANSNYPSYSNPDSYWHIDAEKLSIMVPIVCSVSILIMEIIFFALLYKKVESKDLYLLTLLLVVAVAERTTELIVRPFSQVYYNPKLEYFIEFFIRLLRSSYLIPSVTLTSYLLIKTTMYSLDYNYSNQNELAK